MLKSFLLVFIFLTKNTYQFTNNWKWKCAKDICLRTEGSDNRQDLFRSIEECRLVCGQGSIWPIPTQSFKKSLDLIDIHPSNIEFSFNTEDVKVREFVAENTAIFKENLLKECNGECAITTNQKMFITINVQSCDLSLTWKTDESYKIRAANFSWTIVAKTVYGARHGLESLSHLVAPYIDNEGRRGLVTLKQVDIYDKPVYPHRSLLLDTARNFLTIQSIKRQIDAMAASKLNILHWHATDTQSFPFVSKRVPKLSKLGAFSAEKIYTPNDVQDLVDYARVRGVRILMEIDAPAHAGNGWQFGPEEGLGNLGVCINEKPWRYFCIQPPCGQLNPANPNVYKVLSDLFYDVVDAFPKSEFFHMGGDEVFLGCWNSSQEIVDYLKAKGKGQSKSDFLDLWSEFQEKSLEKFDAVVGNKNTAIMLWSSELTDPQVIEKYLNKDRYIIETWVPSTDPLPNALLEKGYKLVISTKNAWYLDHGFWGITKYYPWRTVYNNKLIKHENVLGGEVCMWGEYVDESGLDSKVWPRAAAAAERLWSNPDFTSMKAEPRMMRHRERLVVRGIGAETLAPFWCYQNEGQCL